MSTPSSVHASSLHVFSIPLRTRFRGITVREGLLLRGMVHGTGLAMLETEMHPRAPVRVGDTVRALVEVTEVRPTSRGNRAVVTSAVQVLNQHGSVVMDYTVKRLLAGPPNALGENA